MGFENLFDHILPLYINQIVLMYIGSSNKLRCSICQFNEAIQLIEGQKAY